MTRGTRSSWFCDGRGAAARNLGTNAEAEDLILIHEPLGVFFVALDLFGQLFDRFWVDFLGLRRSIFHQYPCCPRSAWVRGPDRPPSKRATNALPWIGDIPGSNGVT